MMCTYFALVFRCKQPNSPIPNCHNIYRVSFIDKVGMAQNDIINIVRASPSPVIFYSNTQDSFEDAAS